MKIVVVGTGYVGLVTGTCLAEIGNHVTCVDIDEQKVKLLHQGKLPIYEPGLDTLVERNVREERLSFTTSLSGAVQGAEIIFFALPTPPNEDGSADLSYVLKASAQLGPLLKDYVVVVNKSTVPVGTTAQVRDAIAAHTQVDFDVVSNPEFLREGLAVDDFMQPDRIVIGSRSAKASDIMQELYAPYAREGAQILIMDEASAELTKYAANAFLATKITFMNEIANLAEATGGDVDQIRLGIGADERIGHRFLYAGIGYGGSCFPKDVQALHKIAAKHKYNFQILGAVNDVNQHQRLRLVEKLKRYYGDLAGKRIALWGLAFKPDTDDIREAPSLYIIDELVGAGAHVTAFDPVAMPNIRQVAADKVTLATDRYAAAAGADALLIVTEWAEFKLPDFAKLAEVMAAKVVFDGRNLYDLGQMKELGFYYNSIGRPVINEHVH